MSNQKHLKMKAKLFIILTFDIIVIYSKLLLFIQYFTTHFFNSIYIPSIEHIVLPQSIKKLKQFGC